MVGVVAAAAAVAVVAVVVVVAVVQGSVDINLVHELLVVARLPKELGRGRPKSGQLMVLCFVEELWFIHSGLSRQLTVSQVNLPRAFS